MIVNLHEIVTKIEFCFSPPIPLSLKSILHLLVKDRGFGDRVLLQLQQLPRRSIAIVLHERDLIQRQILKRLHDLASTRVFGLSPVPNVTPGDVRGSLIDVRPSTLNVCAKPALPPAPASEATRAQPDTHCGDSTEDP